MAREISVPVAPELRPTQGGESIRMSAFQGKQRIATAKVDSDKALRGRIPAPKGARLVVSRIDGDGKLVSRGVTQGQGKVNIDQVAPPKKKATDAVKGIWNGDSLPKRKKSPGAGVWNGSSLQRSKKALPTPPASLLRDQRPVFDRRRGLEREFRGTSARRLLE